MTTYARVVDQALERARQVKPDGAIEPALTTAHFQEELEALVQARKNLHDPEKQTTYAAIETAVRNKFYKCLVSLLGSWLPFCANAEVSHLLRSMIVVSVISGIYSILFWLLRITVWLGATTGDGACLQR